MGLTCAGVRVCCVAAEHRILQLLFALNLLPAEAVWKDQYHTKAAGAGAGVAKDEKWALDPAALYTAIRKDRDRDVRMAEKWFAKGKANAGKKTLLHALRAYRMSVALLQRLHNPPAAAAAAAGAGAGPTLLDLSVVNAERRELDSAHGSDSDEWAPYSERYGKLFDALDKQLLELSQKPLPGAAGGATGAGAGKRGKK